jgi:hypothetical protein
MKQIKLPGGILLESASEGFYFEVKGADYGGSSLDSSSSSSSLLSSSKPLPLYTGEYQVIPEGISNNVPIYLRDLLDNNHLGGSVLDKMIGLILAQGMGQYIEEVDAKNNLIVRKWTEDTQISEWLKPWDAVTYITNSLEDRVKGGSVYSKLLRNVGGRPGSGSSAKINELRHVCAVDCRREWPDNKGVINRIFVGDWTDTGTEKEFYPVWNKLTTTLRPTMMAYRTIYRFGRSEKQPVLPNYWGVRNWMGRSTDIPDILNNLSENTLGIKWHIISPQSYWEQKEAKLKEQYEAQQKVWKQEYLEEYKESVLQSLASVLAGKKNVGKFMHTQSIRQILDVGKSDLDKWEFNPLDMKMDKFIESQIKISERADVAIASGIGLSPSLSNIVADGRQGSGSETLYSYKLFRTSSVYKIEHDVFSILNDVIDYNFPNKKIKMGFYSESVMKEQNVTPSDRLVNNSQ